ncbi:hypothetical protein RB595_007704 [Gaeumannomyces hyphopodioides]
MSQMRAIRFIGSSKRSPVAAVLMLQCHVKPGSSKSREGIASLSDDAVELCVAAPPRDDQANKAVVAVLSEALGSPKSDLDIVHGLKSHAKTVAVKGSLAQGTEKEVLFRVTELLRKASQDS